MACPVALVCVCVCERVVLSCRDTVAEAQKILPSLRALMVYVAHDCTGLRERVRERESGQLISLNGLRCVCNYQLHVLCC